MSERSEIDDLRRQLAEADKAHKEYAQHATEQLADVQEKYRLLSAQHVRLCDQVYEEDGETLKQIVLGRNLAKLGKTAAENFSIAVEAQERADIAERKFAEAQKELAAMRLLAAEPMAIQKVRDELGPLSLWTQSGLETHINKCLSEERAAKEAVLADIDVMACVIRTGYTVAPTRQWTDEQYRQTCLRAQELHRERDAAMLLQCTQRETIATLMHDLDAALATGGQRLLAAIDTAIATGERNHE